MAAIIGALLGAATIMLVGKNAKGRDFLGLAIAMFVLSLAVSLMIMPAFHQAEQIAAARSGTATDHLGTAAYIVAGFGAYLVATLPGLLFVGLSKASG